MSNKSERKEEKKEKKKRPLLSKFIILFLFFAVVYIYARYVGTTGLKVKEYSIINENIPSSFDGFSIVQFSDLELGTTFNVQDLEPLVEKINSLNPDVVVFTGDLVSDAKYTLNADEEEQLVESFRAIDPLIGKYAIKGDDDYSGLYDKVIASSDFIDLTNNYELIYYKGLTPIVIYGLGSLLTNDQDYESTFSYPSEEEDTTYMATYRILLAHEPDTADNTSEYNLSLILSGHSHNSELNIPYLKSHYKIKGASIYYDEYYQLGSTELYVSGGLGTSKFKVRLFDRPSISLYRLYTN